MLLVLRRLWIQVTADRRRFGLLCILVAVGLLLWARIIVVSNPPRTAVAGEGDRPPAGGRQAQRSAGSDKDEPAPRRVALARQPMRDPLEINPAWFPKSNSASLLPQDPDKSHPQQAENPDQAEARLTLQLRTLADRFRLEAVIPGRMAVISGRTVQMGDELSAIGDDRVRFRLVAIEAADGLEDPAVVLECEGRRFELKMRNPGSDKRF